MTSRLPRRLGNLSSTFQSRFGHSPAWVAEAPGRVNLIGEHTDYNEGFVLPAAVDLSTLVAAAPAAGLASRAWSDATGEEVALDLRSSQPIEAHPWANYVLGVAWSLEARGIHVPQLDLVITSDLPVGAGLSSSAALELACVTVMSAAAGTALTSREAAVVTHRAETEFVGVPCGLMDQLVCALAVRDHALLIDCRSLETEPVPLPLRDQGLSLVVVDSGVPRHLAGSAYRERRAQCDEAVGRLSGIIPGIVSLRDLVPEQLPEVAGVLPPLLFWRVRHVVTENARVLRCVESLRDGDMDEVGRLLKGSHISLRDDYEVSTPELDLLVELAWNAAGVVGARLTGAGFGGSTVNLVRSDTVDSFGDRVVEVYRERTGRPARMYLCAVSGGASLVHG